ncbi:MAG: GNAT family N-acetyltransferase [bacterium]
MKVTDFQGPALILKKEVLDLYIHDLNKPIKKIITELPIDIRTLKQPIELENVSASRVTQHIASKQNAFVASYRAKPVGYLFATISRCRVGEIHDFLMVAPQEVYLFNAYVYRMFRGKRIYRALITHAAQYYKDKSFTKALIFTAQNNTTSISGIEKAGFKCYGSVHFSNVLGRKSWKYSRRTSDSQSYFIHEV